MSKVLLAEANAAARKRLTNILASKHQVQPVGLSENLAEEIRAAGADLVILDMKLPHATGLRILQRIRKSEPAIPVIVLTATSGTVRKALASGATDYLAKPFDAIELRHRVERCLRARPIPSAVTRHSPGALAPATARPVVLQELHDPETGRLDAAKIAEYLAVPLAQLARALGANYATVHKTPAALALQERLLPIKTALVILSELFRDQSTVRAWLNSPHPDLGKRTPLAVILEGHGDAVAAILENAIEGIAS